ncbi:hypothetical protein [uncultured Leifsonia sp.]|uniref:hypothetical protein n=1 Tax=uncultured Leifsonia sp. TaxID=340359 RepID=UPI0025CC6EEE|nr:hypothetical protein [uncultured Leifsonia sp.]
MTVGVAAASHAVGKTDDDAGQLELNADVLVNESVSAGTSGDFAIRGRLFSEELSARAQERREALVGRLDVLDRLTFEPTAVVADEYQPVRAALFEGYSSEMLSQTREAEEDSQVLAVLALTAGLPLVVIAGVSLGRLRAKRKGASP